MGEVFQNRRETKERFEIAPGDAPFEPGFNVKTLWAALFVGFVMLPGAIYLGLVTGQSMAGGGRVGDPYSVHRDRQAHLCAPAHIRKSSFSTGWPAAW